MACYVSDLKRSDRNQRVLQPGSQGLQAQVLLQPQVLQPLLQPQELQELLPQPQVLSLTPPTLPQVSQQGLQQEFATKSGNTIPLQLLQELQAISLPPYEKDVVEESSSTTSYAPCSQSVTEKGRRFPRCLYSQALQGGLFQKLPQASVTSPVSR